MVATWLQLPEFATNVWNVLPLIFVRIANKKFNINTTYWKWKKLKNHHNRKILTSELFLRPGKSYFSKWSTIILLQNHKMNNNLTDTEDGREDKNLRRKNLLIIRWTRKCLNWMLFLESNKISKSLLLNTLTWDHLN